MALSGATALPALALLVDRDPRLRRWRWSGTAAAVARETAVVLALFTVWQLAARAALRQVSGAFDHAAAVLAAERWLPLPTELWVQQAVLPHETLVRWANTFYVYAHLNSMMVFLAWMFLRHRAEYPRTRTLMVVVTGTCLLLQMVPVAPPRMLAELGFVDTALRYGQSVYGPFGSGIANQLAAMPSVHMAWAALIAVVVVAVGRSPWRWLVVVHPVLTMVVVVATANHYWLDGIVAVAILAVALPAVGARWSGGHLRLAGAATRPLAGHDDTRDEQLAAPDAPGLPALQRTGEAGQPDGAVRAQRLGVLDVRRALREEELGGLGPARDRRAGSLDLGDQPDQHRCHL